MAINKHPHVQAGREKVLGFITCHDSEERGGYVYVECLSVSEEYTGWAREGYTNVKGLGKELVRRAMAHAGVKAVEASIRSKNGASIRCFESAAKDCNRSFIPVKQDASEISKPAKDVDYHWVGVESTHGLLIRYRMEVQ